MRYRLSTAALLAIVATVAASCTKEEKVTGPIGLPSFANGNDSQQCEVIDFNSFSHGDAITSVSLFGGDAMLSVTAFRNAPAGAVPATAYDTELWDDAGNPPPNDTHNDTQKNIDCPDCDGIMVVIPDVNFADDGDDTDGGTVTFSGFSSDFFWQIPTYSAVDDDGEETILLRVGAGLQLVGSSSGLGNGTVETVMTTAHVFNDQAQVEFLGSGGFDNVEVCREGPGVGRMTGGGAQITVIAPGGEEVRVTRGLTLHCDITLSNNLEINWPGPNQWHLEKESLTSVRCIDTEVVQDPPKAPFDTFIAEAVGRLNGVPGSIIRFQFTDAGEPGRNDMAGMQIWAPGADPNVDPPVLDIPNGTVLDHGNLQAHFDQPHGNKG